MKRMKGSKLKQKYFSHKEGILLQHQLANHEAYAERRMKIFAFNELQKATNNFDPHKKIGQGVLGSVYRGILPDKTVVAIKKLKVVNAARIVNEVIALSQINHRNVVRLLGCCLQTRKPLLVYEYFSNIGTLYNHTYGRESSPFSLQLRMKIAAEIAAALAYLHSSTSKPIIIHKNVKTMNILLDDKYMVKLTDSGFSPLRGRIKMQRTLGYLDPECLHSNTLTGKSDVYSFGVVLAELITSRRAASPHRPEAERSLAHVFARAIEGDIGDLHEILDEEILVGDIEMVEKVADLAYRCIRERGEERPSMKEVAMELEALRIMAKHPEGMLSFSESPERTEHFVTPPSDAYVVDVRGEGFDDGSSIIRTNAEEIGYRRLQEVDYYLT
ncbi:putative transferase, protein kinase RLK-Pelle-WAK family [Rosa chinensis]|uniref:Putative transferase, protein kinase RLK-Pelle-WAK family n=1 Tax=Rosa chinensis TaxID=74649 RepID=A0A2P6SJL2_ROSCH|nr:wall-associated receptor kinase 3 [Rosa chinensis]PRQ58870.1 putative transferase, protein kinase RLK-Pelle-WAK family [Rosa chinensis]